MATLTKRKPGGTGVLNGAPTASTSPRKQHRHSKAGRAHATVTRKAWHGKNAPLVSLPPIAYKRGPFVRVVPSYDWRFWAIRGNLGDTVLIEEIESVSWDDASAVLTGAITFRSPDWAKALQIQEGHEIRAEYSVDEKNWTPLWRMRMVQPNADLAVQQRTMNLVNDLQRLMSSTDDFTFVKDKAHPKGWRVDQVILFVFNRYGVAATVPVMKALITDWHLTDQHPLDVIHSALLREKHTTGLRYAVSLDWQNHAHITAYKRPGSLLEMGPELLAATYSSQFDTRFATALTVRSDQAVKKVAHDKRKHRKVTFAKLAVSVQTAGGVKQYGYIHRNLYSPDAKAAAKASAEGKLFLAAVARPQKQFSVTMPGMPDLRRLDAIRFRLPERGLSQVVYVVEAKHTVDGTSGYTTECVLNFDDPFRDKKLDVILNKLTDVATATGRVPPVTTSGTTNNTNKNNQAHKPRVGVLNGAPTAALRPRAPRTAGTKK